MMTRRQLIVLVVLGGVGCARSDWIESTLVTVDVTGEWTGEWTQPQFGGSVTLVLQQEGSRITGNLVSFTGTNYAGPIEGTVTGDILTLRQPQGRLQLELTVNGDEMTGTGARPSGKLALKLRRSR